MGDTADTTAPIIFHVAPGTYQECVVFPDTATDWALIGSGITQTIIRPAVTAATDVAGGVIRIGADVSGSDTRAETARIEIAWLTVQNDAWSGPESAISVGEENGPADGAAAVWQDVYLHDLEAIGAHDAVHVFGSRLGTDINVPRIYIWNVLGVSGADTFIKKGFSAYRGWNLEGISKTNWCETSTTTFLSAQTGTLAGADSNTIVQIAAADDFGVTDGYVGRKIALAAGPCAAGNQGWITVYNTSTDKVTFTPAAGFTPDATCTYTIDAVPNSNTASVTANGIAPPCTDIDWTTIRASGAGDGYWKNTGFHFGVIALVPAAAPDGDLTEIRDSRFRVEVNDFGPDPAVSTQVEVAGIFAYTSRWQDAFFDNIDISVGLHIDAYDTITPTNPIGGIIFYDTGSMTFEGDVWARNIRVRIDNTSDPDENDACIAVDDAATGDDFDLFASNIFCDINDTAAGDAGTTTTLYQTGAGVTLGVGSVISDAGVTTSGTITLLSGGRMFGSAALDFNFGGATDQGTCLAAQTITVPGAAVNDSVEPGIPNASTITGVEWKFWVSSANTVSVLPCCVTTLDCADTPSGTFTAAVTRR